MSSVVAWNSGSLDERMRSKSALLNTGERNFSRRVWSGLSSRMLPSGPMNVVSDITSFSRMGSMGGLVTWANSCLK